MEQAGARTLLERNGAKKEVGDVIVPEHIDKIKDFYHQGAPAALIRR
jgi:hypothetical protein